MSFRARLALFFVVIVILPMAAVTAVTFTLISDNEDGRAQAQRAARLEPARRLSELARRRARVVADQVAADERLAAAVAAGARTGVDTRAREISRALGVRRLVVRMGDAHPMADVGVGDALFPVTRRFRGDGPTATMRLSVQSAGAYAAELARVTGHEVVVEQGSRTLATTLEGATAAVLPPGARAVEVGGHRYQVASFATDGFGAPVTVAVLASRWAKSDATGTRWLIGAILAAFLLVAVGVGFAIWRSLERQMARLLTAARRLGAGESTAKVPTAGRDELAALGTELNTMAAQLEDRLQQLSEERGRLGRSMRRLGAAVAANLDRDGLLAIVVEAAVEGADADGGRAVTRRSFDGPLDERAQVGRLDGLEQALADVEADAVASGVGAELRRGELSALAHPLHGGARPDVLGVVSVARHGQPFTDGDRELFSYLAGQAAVSIENVGLHETVRRQASTDALTGLSTRRRFDEVLVVEVERARRYPDQELGLVLLDIDDFKAVNDTHGHQVGDEVLRQVAQILRDSSRESDLPARYGGEELAIVLPATDIQGVYDMAERVRTGIERLAVPAGDTTVRVTVSLGATTMSAGQSAAELIATADAALYEAKRAGKNRTARAGVG